MGHRTLRTAGVVICAIVISLWSAAAEAANLVVSMDKDGKQPALRYEMDPTGTAATFNLYVHNTTDAAVKGVSFSGSLMNGDQPLAGVTVKFMAFNGMDGALGPFDVPANSSRVVQFSVTNLNKAGIFTGAVLMASGSDTTSIPLTIVRMGIPVLSLQEADPKNVVNLTVYSQEFNFPLTVMETGGDAGAKVTIAVGPISREDGVASNAAKIDSPRTGQEIEVVPHGFHVLNLKGRLPETAKYRTWITLSYGQKFQAYNVSIERKARLDFTIVGLGAQSPLSIPLASRSLQRKITIQLAEGQADVRDLDIDLDVLTREDGQPPAASTLDLKFDPAAKGPFTLKAGDQLNVNLIGENLEPAKYLSKLFLKSGGRTQTVSIELNRAALVPSVTLDDPGTTGATVWGWSNTADAKVLIHEMLGRDTPLYLPALESLQRVNANNPSIDLPDQPRTLYQRKNNQLVEVAPQDCVTPAPQEVVNIGPRANLEYVFRVEDLGPGKYKGRIAVSGPELARVAKDFEIYVRHACYWAWLVIVIGVAGSFGLHYYTRVHRINLVRTVNVTRTVEMINKDSANSPDDEVWQFLGSQLAQLKGRIGTDRTLTQVQFDKILTDVQARRKQYLSALMQQRRFQQILAAYPPSLLQEQADSREKLDHKFTEIVNALLNPDSDVLSEQAGVSKSVRELTELAADAQKTLITVAADALLADIGEFVSLTLPEPSTKALSDAKKIQADVVKIQAAADTSLTGLDRRLGAAYQRYLALRQHEIRQRVENLKANRDASPALPAHWTAFDAAFDEVTRLLPPENVVDADPMHALNALNEANRSLQVALLEYLDVSLKLGQPGELKPAEWAAVDQRPVAALIANARNAAANADGTGLAAAYQNAKGEYVSLQFKVLNLRIEKLRKLITDKPKFVPEEPWEEKLGKEPLKTAIDALATLAPDGQRPLREREAALDQAQQKFLKQRVDSLGTALNCAKELIPPPPPEEFVNQFTSVEQAVQRAQADLDTFIAANPFDPRKFAAAEQAGVAAQREYEELAQRSLKKPLQLLDGVVDFAETQFTGGFWGGLPDIIPELDQPSVRPHVTARMASFFGAGAVGTEPSSVELVRQIKSADGYVSWLAVILASLGGVLALWVPNQSWGSVQDYLIALLWGFGLHEAGNTIVDKLMGQAIGSEEK